MPGDHSSKPVAISSDGSQIIRQFFKVELFLVSKPEDSLVCLRVRKKRLEVGEEWVGRSVRLWSGRSGGTEEIGG